MKTFSIFRMFAAMMTAVVLAFALTSAGRTAEISFDSTVHEFGNIREADGPVSCVFKYTNTGDAPLVIIAANAACGCTKPKYDAAPLAPGKTGSITVKYIPAGRPGEFNKTIKVRTNAKKTKVVKLRIRGNVIPDK